MSIFKEIIIEICAKDRDICVFKHQVMLYEGDKV